jgi:hypothetical protein
MSQIVCLCWSTNTGPMSSPWCWTGTAAAQPPDVSTNLKPAARFSAPCGPPVPYHSRNRDIFAAEKRSTICALAGLAVAGAAWLVPPHRSVPRAARCLRQAPRCCRNASALTLPRATPAWGAAGSGRSAAGHGRPVPAILRRLCRIRVSGCPTGTADLYENFDDARGCTRFRCRCGTRCSDFS